MIKCAFYEKEITPPLGSEIPGYYAVRVSTGVLDRLYVKSAVFGSDEPCAAIISIDAVELPGDICQKIAARVQEFTGIPAEAVGICATHTHLGIPCGEPVGAKSDDKYMEELCRIAADCVTLAAQRLRPCNVSFGTGSVGDISFVRDYLMRDGSVCTNPTASAEILRPYSENDPLVPVLAFYDQDGVPTGALISFACHHDCIGGTQFSGDYSSELSRQLKARYGNEFVSVYLAGACGDINHINFPAGTASNYLDMGRRLAAQAASIIDASGPSLCGDVTSQRSVVHCAYRRASADEIETAKRVLSTGEADSHTMLGSLMSELLLDYESKISASGKTELPLPIQLITVCGINIFMLPGEIYHEFASQIRREAGSSCLFATLCNGDFGYIPTPDLFGSCVYPVQLCEGSKLEPAAGEKIVRAAVALAKSPC